MNLAKSWYLITIAYEPYVALCSNSRRISGHFWRKKGFPVTAIHVRILLTGGGKTGGWVMLIKQRLRLAAAAALLMSVTASHAATRYASTWQPAAICSYASKVCYRPSN